MKSELRCNTVGRPSGTGSYIAVTFNRPVSEEEWRRFREHCRAFDAALQTTAEGGE